MGRGEGRQALWIGVILFGLLGGAIGVVLLASESDHLGQRRIARQASDVTTVLAGEFERQLAGAQGLATDLGTSLPGLTRSSYQQRVLQLFDAGVIATDRTILSVAQLVPAAEVMGWSAALPADVAEALDLRLGSGDQHLVLTHAWPYDRGRDVFGVDVFGLEVPGPVAAAALAADEARATPPVQLLGERAGRNAIVSYLPLRDADGIPNGVLVLGVVLDEVLEDLALDTGQGLVVTDVATGELAATLGTQPGDLELRADASVLVLDREFDITVGASRASLLTGLERSLTWLVGVLGLVIALLGAVALTADRRRTAATATEVAERTTELRRAQELLLRRNADLAAADRIKDEVLAVVSHDLRTPITVIGGLAELLQRDASLNDMTRDALVRIERQAARVEDLVADLLTAAQTQGYGAVHAETVDLVATLHVLLADLQLDAVIEAPERALATVDADHFARILENLLTNARKYGAPPFELTIVRAAAGWEVRVRDHGTGIDAGDEGTIFDAFHQVGRTRQGGVGLGLTIALRLARANGGDVSYEVPDGDGACFVVTLPAAVEPGDA